ncbi:MAG: HAD-IA family hydrolase [Chloroflexi bacterium]|nr:HAD-IA family hydrolase [Chloroflexota bacterium]
MSTATDIDGQDGMSAYPSIADVQSIIFDFDYTLADSSDGVIECANYALRRLGLPTATDDSIRRTIGLSLPRTLTALAGDEHSALGDEFMRIFLERAEKMMPDATMLFDFVPSLVDTLLGHGIELGIVSSGRRWRISRVLRREELDSQFKVIVGIEDVDEPKPDPTGLLRAVAKLDTPKKRCLYVGDSTTDAETARRAGVRFAAVLSGVTPREAFAEYAPVTVLESAAELPGALRGAH